MLRHFGKKRAVLKQLSYLLSLQASARHPTSIPHPCSIPLHGDYRARTCIFSVEFRYPVPPCLNKSPEALTGQYPMYIVKFRMHNTSTILSLGPSRIPSRPPSCYLEVSTPYDYHDMTSETLPLLLWRSTVLSTACKSEESAQAIHEVSLDLFVLGFHEQANILLKGLYDLGHGLEF